RAGDVKAAKPAGTNPKFCGAGFPVGFWKTAGGSGGSGKHREADLLSHASLRGGAWLMGSPEIHGTCGRAGRGQGTAWVALVLAAQTALGPFYIRLYHADRAILFLTPQALLS